jgi:hypothetical protein
LPGKVAHALQDWLANQPQARPTKSASPKIRVARE